MEYAQVIDATFKVVVAFFLALPVAWDREVHGVSLGLRTFPLVAVGCCAYVLLAQRFLGPEDAPAMARILQGLLSGIGFVGGGAILKGDDRVRGTASAASIWMMGAIGASVALGEWDLAVLVAVANLATVVLLTRLKPAAEASREADS